MPSRIIIITIPTTIAFITAQQSTQSSAGAEQEGPAVSINQRDKKKPRWVQKNYYF